MNYRLVVIFVLAVVCALTTSVHGQVKTHIDDLVSKLYQNPWSGAGLIGESPTIWGFNLTEPMREILDVGKPAQPFLLEKISDSAVTDQVIFLLGGVGDEMAIEPIINAMVGENDLHKTPNSKRINRAANLALTNITVADVIWHHGGGVVVERCQGRQKECWQKWWKWNRFNFSVSTIKQSRGYSNYPNYGIHRNKQ